MPDAPRATPQADRTPHWAERYVRLLDDGVKIPGTNIGVGLDALLGFVLPGAGDVLTGISGLALFYAAHRQGVPKRVLARMALNLAIDLGVGVVPVVGDGFDLFWKSNRKNLQLIERHRDAPEGAHKTRDLVMLALALLAVFVTLGGVLFVLFATLHWLFGVLQNVLS